MKQSPGTTVINIVQSFRDMGLGESLYSAEQRRAVRSSGTALTDDGRVTAEAIADLHWERVSWYIETPSDGTNAGAQHLMPQGGVVRLIDARSVGPASSSPFSAQIVATGWGSAESVSFPQGTTSGHPSRLSRDVVPGSVLSLNITSSGGATGLTVTVFFSPLGGA